MSKHVELHDVESVRRLFSIATAAVRKAVEPWQRHDEVKVIVKKMSTSPGDLPKAFTAPPETMNELWIVPGSIGAARIHLFVYSPNEIAIEIGENGFCQESWCDEENEAVEWVTSVVLSVASGRFVEYVQPGDKKTSVGLLARYAPEGSSDWFEYRSNWDESRRDEAVEHFYQPY